MIRKWTALSLVAGAALAMTACQSPADKDRDARKAQIEADKSKAEAQQNADQKRTTADQQLMGEKDDYREKVQKDMVDVDKHVDDIEANAATATGADKADYDRTLADVVHKRDALQADVRGINASTADTWSTVKAKIDRDLDDYKSAVKTASSKIKAGPRGQTQPQPTTTTITPSTAAPTMTSRPGSVPGSTGAPGAAPGPRGTTTNPPARP